MIGKIKDLIYNFNDIFVALLILLIASGIIVWKLADIMEYPTQGGKTEVAVNTTVDFSDIDLNQTVVDDFNEDPENVGNGSEGEGAGENGSAEGNTSEANETSENTTDENASSEQTGPVNNVPGEMKEYTIKLVQGKNTSWSAVRNELYDNGIISSKEDFMTVVNDPNDKYAFDRRLQASGSYKVNSKMSYTEILKILCNIK